MKGWLKLNSNFIAWVIGICLIVWTWWSFISDVITKKIDSYEKEVIQANAKITKLEIEKQEKSDIEKLEELAKESADNAKNSLTKIEEIQKTVDTERINYENNTLRQRCYSEQISRKINWLEYNIDYCKDNSVLENFRVKK